MQIDFIADLLEDNQPAVAVFTHGPEFVRHADDTGHTGSWLFGSSRVKDRFFQGITVFVYLHANNQRTIFRAKCKAVTGPITDDKGRARFRLLLEDIETVGLTNNKWFTCANTRRQDFAYFND